MRKPATTSTARLRAQSRPAVSFAPGALAGVAAAGSVNASSMSIRTSAAVAAAGSSHPFPGRAAAVSECRGGTSAGKRVQSGSLFSTAPECRARLRPRTPARPVSISYSTQPNAKMSVRWSTGRPFACSGDMYAAVPRITPAFVAAMLSVGEFERVRIRRLRSRTPSPVRSRAPSLCRPA